MKTNKFIVSVGSAVALLATPVLVVGCAGGDAKPDPAPSDATMEKSGEGSCGGEKAPEGSCGGEKKEGGEGSCGEGSCGGH